MYELLREDILTLQLKAGERVNINSISRNMGVSLGPVREALNRLLRDGLIIQDTRWGYFVVQLTN